MARKVRQISVRVQQLTVQKTALADDLTAAKKELEELADGGEHRARSPFDLDEDDWEELRDEGTVKFRVPCTNRSVDNKKLAELLDTDTEGVEAVLAAQKRSAARTWDAVRPLCVQAIGDESIADMLGTQTCMHVVVGTSRKGKDGYASHRDIADIRSGKRPVPGEDEDVNAALRLFLTMTSAARDFETDLANTFEPDHAKEIAYSRELCGAESTFGGPKPPPR